MTPQLEQLFKTCHFVLIPIESALYKEFGVLLQEQMSDDIMCVSGEAPELSQKGIACVYFPKDLNDINMYDDKDQAHAEGSKTTAEELYQSILEEGTIVTELPND